MMKSLSPLFIAAALLAAGGCASTPSEYGVRTVSDELAGNSDAAWAAIDSNGDGTLSLAELQDQRAMGLLQDLDNADSNHDDGVSRAEWNAWWPRMTNHHIRAGVTPAEDATLAP